MLTSFKQSTRQMLTSYKQSTFKRIFLEPYFTDSPSYCILLIYKQNMVAIIKLTLLLTIHLTKNWKRKQYCHIKVKEQSNSKIYVYLCRYLVVQTAFQIGYKVSEISLEKAAFLPLTKRTGEVNPNTSTVFASVVVALPLTPNVRYRE